MEVAEAYNWDLERIYEHLANLQPYFYKTDANHNTGWIRQALLEEIAQIFNKRYEQIELENTQNAWEKILKISEKPVALFTTNFDLVLEQLFAFQNISFANGWRDNEFNKDNFLRGSDAKFALVKLHGSADWEESRNGSTSKIVRKGFADKALAQVACMEPLRKKWPIEEPYASAYDCLEKALKAASRLWVVGFSWRDISLAAVMRRALQQRNEDRIPIGVRVIDRFPQQVEERVRFFLNRSSAKEQIRKIVWRYFKCNDFPNYFSLDSGQPRPILKTGKHVDLDSGWENFWLKIPGEPEMAYQPEEGKSLVRWDQERTYFESGRFIFLPLLPQNFEIRLTIKIIKYGSGWDPGIGLFDLQGDELISARFIRAKEDWKAKSEPNISGLRISNNGEITKRLPIKEGTAIELLIKAEAPKISLLVDKQRQLLIDNNRKVIQLQLGCYPWYSDEGTFRPGHSAECEIGPCIIKIK